MTEITIPEAELEFSYARSSGPGGQNVNKVNSKVILRWNPVQSNALSEGVRARFLARFGGRLTSDGSLLLTSDRYRDQPRNREDCMEKLHAMLREVATPPKPRRKTRPTRGSVERRKTGKRRHAEKKKLRRSAADHDG